MLISWANGTSLGSLTPGCSSFRAANECIFSHLRARQKPECRPLAVSRCKAAWQERLHEDEASPQRTLSASFSAARQRAPPLARRSSCEKIGRSTRGCRLEGLERGLLGPVLFAIVASRKKGGLAMSDDWKEQKWAQDFWYSGKITRRKLLGYGAASAGALGATMLVPAPWRPAFGQAKPYKI